MRITYYTGKISTIQKFGLNISECDITPEMFIDIYPFLVMQRNVGLHEKPYHFRF